MEANRKQSKGREIERKNIDEKKEEKIVKRKRREQ